MVLVANVDIVLEVGEGVIGNYFTVFFILYQLLKDF